MYAYGGIITRMRNIVCSFQLREVLNVTQIGTYTTQTVRVVENGGGLTPPAAGVADLAWVLWEQ